MAILKKLTILCLSLLVAYNFCLQIVKADVSVCPYTTGSQECVNYYEEQVSKAKAKGATLASQIAFMDSQMALTAAQISLTEEKLVRVADEISSASAKITQLEDALTHTSEVLVNRIAVTYKQGNVDPLLIILTTDNFGNLTQRLEYLRLVQKHDKALMERMSLTRKTYKDRRDDLVDLKVQQEQLKKKLKAYKDQLEVQKQEKQALLVVTRNDESRYQQMLTEARRELEALKASKFDGKRDVKKGDVIGLMGSTGFSTGPHLHFGVYNLSEGDADKFVYASGVNNPLDYLKGRTLSVDSGACYGKSGSASFGSGGWDWPMANPRISQCFGSTPYSFVYANGRHDGLDMYDSGNLAIRAVDDGVAYFYRGNSSLGNNVRVFHSNGKMTLYLHMQ